MLNIFVYCEGNTEYNYIQELNKLLNEEGCFDVRFTAENLNGIKTNDWISKIKKHTPNKNYFNQFFVWIDFDIFKRIGLAPEEIKDELKSHKLKGKIAILLLNYMNGEDFLILSYGSEKINQWKEECNRKNHFENPMHSNVYLPLFQTIIPDYEKGSLPSEIEPLTKENLEYCIHNIQDSTIPFKSDIEVLLQMVLDKLK